MSTQNFYITTTLPYVNSDPHLGFAAEIVHADILARFALLEGKNVFFNTGTDEHGLKIYRKALEAGITPHEYVDKYASRFLQLKSILGLLPELHFIRTTDSHHVAAAQAFWLRCQEHGDIYKKNYQIKYCVGCELEKTDSELVNGKCPLHPNVEIEFIEEENYFFKFSNYQQKLLDLYEQKKDFVVPDFRLKEIKSFVAQGLQDFSISRLKEKMPWGVPVPGDDTQVMYVWFDALVNYISTLGWPENKEQFSQFWPGVQIAGKDNLRQQSAMWQAMLQSCGLPNSSQIIIRGFITAGGQKMSKSLGNVVDPFALVEEFGTDALRFYIARELNPFEDSDFTHEKFKESYTAGLVNGLGNTVSRILTMAKNASVTINMEYDLGLDPAVSDALESRDIRKAIEWIWEKLTGLDQVIQTEEPYKTIKTDPEKAKALLSQLLMTLYVLAVNLAPFLPETSQKILNSIEKLPNLETVPHLFPRIE